MKTVLLGRRGADPIAAAPCGSQAPPSSSPPDGRRGACASGVAPGLSEFFLDTESWIGLRERVLPRALGAGQALKVWSAGCASGAEAYSLAILLDDLSPGVPHFLLATDIDRAALARASEGAYERSEVLNVPLHYRRYLAGRNSRYHVTAALMDRVVFSLHNLLSDPFETEFDLIACRNVIPCIPEDARIALFDRFHAALSPGGVLFLGVAERIQDPRARGLAPLEPGFYGRID